MDVAYLESLVIDGETGYPRLTPHEQRNMNAESYEYSVCRKCILEECDDTHPRCPLTPINAEKRQEERPKKKGQGTAIPVMIVGIRYSSISEACKSNGVSLRLVYSRAKRHGITPQAVLQAIAGF